jgi:hypothetical protein
MDHHELHIAIAKMSKILFNNSNIRFNVRDLNVKWIMHKISFTNIKIYTYREFKGNFVFSPTVQLPF